MNDIHNVELHDYLRTFWCWLRDGESGSTTIRNLGLVIAAAIGLPLAIWRSVVAARQADAAQKHAETAQRVLLNERYQKAAEMLGSAVLSVRLGSIYALAGLAREYPDTFHLPVMQLFAAFVVGRTSTRETVEQVGSTTSPTATGNNDSSNLDPVHSGDEKENDSKDSRRRRESWSAEFSGTFFLTANRKIGPVPRLAKDVKEAMRSILRRDKKRIALERKEGFGIDLANVSLPGLVFHETDCSDFDFTKADLRRIRAWETRFSNAVLPGSDLSGASLHGADFRDADMRRVNLTAARLVGADLRKANLGLVDLVGQNLWKGELFPSKLVGTQLQGADLGEVDLGCADMHGALLAGADLTEANLTRANGLTQEQLDEAKADPGRPPILEGVLDPITNKPLIWRGRGAGERR